MKLKKYKIIISILIILSLQGFSNAAPKKQAARKEILKYSDTNETKVIKKKTESKSDPEEEKKKKEDAEFAKKKSDESKGKWIEETLDYGLNADRKEAINRITLIKDKGVKDKLLKRLIDVIKNESESDVVHKAITICSELDYKEAAGVITDKLEDSTDEMKTAAAYALKKLNAVNSKEKLIKKFKEINLTKDSNFTEASLAALGEFKAVELAPYAKEKIEDNKTTLVTKELLIMFLGNSGAVESKDILMKIYKSEDENQTLRSYAANSLSKMNIKEAAADFKAVIKQIEDYPFKKKQAYYSLYMYSVTALVRLGDKDAAPKVRESLRSNSPAVRLQAIKLLVELKDKSSIDILKYKMKYDPSKKVRKTARKALKEFGVELKGEDEKESGEDEN
jgi:HEAT repeat protein